jgi:hypothetical protein
MTASKPPMLVTTASRLASPHTAAVFVDGVLFGWGPSCDLLAAELRSRADLTAADLLPPAERRHTDRTYRFGDGRPW